MKNFIVAATIGAVVGALVTIGAAVIGVLIASLFAWLLPYPWDILAMAFCAAALISYLLFRISGCFNEFYFPGLDLTPLGPGVTGFAVEKDNDELWVPLLFSTIPGTESIERYLDTLPTDKRVVFINVTGRQLSRMLRRRGFRRTTLWEAGCSVPAWTRSKDSAAAP